MSTLSSYSEDSRQEALFALLFLLAPDLESCRHLWRLLLEDSPPWIIIAGDRKMAASIPPLWDWRDEEKSMRELQEWYSSDLKKKVVVGVVSVVLLLAFALLLIIGKSFG